MTIGRLTIEDCLLSFHHNGLAVSEPSRASLFLQLQGYEQGGTVFDPTQRVHLAIWHHTVAPDFELIWPGNGPSPVDNIIKQHGPQIYHCCFETSCREAVLEKFEKVGLFVVTVSDPTPAPLFEGRDVSFHFVEGFGLIELLSVI